MSAQKIVRVGDTVYVLIFQKGRVIIRRAV